VSLAKRLYELQQLDLELEAGKASLKLLESQMGEDPAVIKAKKVLEQAQQLLLTLEKAQRDIEWEIEDLQTKISSLDKKLYDGSVRSPKELLSLQQDIEHLKARKREKEDKALEIMSQVEEKQEEVEMRRREAAKLEEEWQERQRRLLAERAELQERLTEGERKRQSVATGLNPATLELYELLRVRKQGRAVARVEQGRCQGCRLSLPVSDLQQARAEGQLAHCSSCGRILYLPI
jgi:hypothetical protein